MCTLHALLIYPVHAMLIVQIYSLSQNKVVMEYGGYDLGKIIKQCRNLAGWSSLHIRSISCQILAGLNYLYSTNITHRVGYI